MRRVTAERQRVRGAQAQAEENLAKQREVLDVIGKSQAAYKHVFGFAEWRSACEARSPRLAPAPAVHLSCCARGSWPERAGAHKCSWQWLLLYEQALVVFCCVNLQAAYCRRQGGSEM